jgi:Flagellar biosynthesis pathway, component FlhB
MASGDDSEERTEDATPRQREKARDEGRVASSREVGTLAVLSAATFRESITWGLTWRAECPCS